MFFRLGEATSLGEGKLWIQTCQTPLKKIDLVSYPARAEGLVNSTMDKLSILWESVLSNKIKRFRSLGFMAYQPLLVIQRQINFYVNNLFYLKQFSLA